LVVFAVHCFVILFPRELPSLAERSATEYLPHAVIGFFILSGLVLALPFVGGRPRPFSAKSFYFERFFRLYPVYWLSIVLALSLRFLVMHTVGLASISSWPRQFWGIEVTPRVLLQHLAGFIDTVARINPVTWTLANEIQACLFFPFIVVLVKKTRHWTFAIGAIVALIVASYFEVRLTSLNVIRTLNYFLMGAYVAKYNEELKLVLQRLPRMLLGIGSVFLVGFVWIAPGSALLFRLAFIVFNILLALLMVSVQAFRPAAALARLRPVQRMADLSYSFYLVHLPILTACAYLLAPQLHSRVLTILFALSISISVAWAVWLFVEMPIRRWAKRSTGETGRSENPEGYRARHGAAY
jgi:peptidoglycan/LPS O-acetylase OafA/YrhL